MSNWYRNIALVALILCLGFVNSIAQNDSAVVLNCYAPPSIVKFNKNFPNTLSLHTGKLDTSLEYAFANFNIAEGLKMQNSIHVKSYGTGLQSVAFRGTGAEHTSVNWNGVSLNSTLNGQVDFSLLPSFFIDDLSIDFGTGGVGVGSGAVGGAIHSESRLSFVPHSGIRFLGTGGSFNFFNSGLDYSLSNGKFSSRTRIYYQDSEGDFKYKNKFKTGAPEDRMENNSSDLLSAMQQIGFKSGKHEIEYSIWGLSSVRNFGKPNNQGTLDLQDDEFVKSVLSHNFNYNKNLTIRTILSHSYDYLRFESKGVFANSHSLNQVSASVNTSYRAMKRWYINSRLEYLDARGKSESLTGDATRTMGGHTASVMYKNKSEFYMKTSVRNQFANTDVLPSIVGVGMGWKVNGNVILTASLNQIYRLPTLNDLYWMGSGNENLKPEKGWKEDVSLKWVKNKIKAEVSSFNILLDDWLIWLPDGSVWRPQNIRKVRSRGIELSVSRRFSPNRFQERNKKGKKVSLEVSGQYSYTKSTNVEVEKGNEDALYKQLIYVPFHKAGITVSGYYESWFLRTRTNYSGKIYTSSANDSELDGFALMSVSLGRVMHLKKTKVMLSLSVKNLMDERYELVEGRPVPGRTIWMKLNINLINNKSNK
jgi:vitamin B12 transporter